MSESERTLVPAYVSKKTFDGFMAGLRVGIPGQIDRSLLRTYSGSAQTALIASLRFLGLIDADGVPSPALSKLVNAEGEHGKVAQREVIKSAYPFLFKHGFNVATATPRMLEQAFGEAGAQGDTIRKCIAFFVLFAKEAEIPLSPHLRAPIVRAARTTRPRQNGVKKGVVVPPPPPKPPSGGEAEKTPSEMLLAILNPSDMTDQETDAVWTLMKYLKKQGR